MAIGRLLRVDALLERGLRRELHLLYLACMPELRFKRPFAAAFTALYFSLSVQYVGGVGLREDTVFLMCVQLLTTPVIVHGVIGRGLLQRILLSFDYCMHAASTWAGEGAQPVWPADGGGGRTASINCDSAVLVHRRYDYMLKDLEYVMTIDGVAAQISASPPLLQQLAATIGRLHLMAPQTRYVHAHVEHESRAWVHAINLHIALSIAFPPLLTPISDLATPLDLSSLGEPAEHHLPLPAALLPTARARAEALGGAVLGSLLRRGLLSFEYEPVVLPITMRAAASAHVPHVDKSRPPVLTTRFIADGVPSAGTSFNVSGGGDSSLRMWPAPPSPCRSPLSHAPPPLSLTTRPAPGPPSFRCLSIACTPLS